MKHLVVAAILALSVSVAALAQTTPRSTRSTAASQSAASDKSKSEKLKGCIQSMGGQYVLGEKHGKQVTLTGQDFSAHVGHSVTVHGTYAKGSFVVSKMDMLAEQCSGAKFTIKGMNNTHTNASGKPSPYRY